MVRMTFRFDAFAAVVARCFHHDFAAVDFDFGVGLDAFGLGVERGRISVGGAGCECVNFAVVHREGAIGGDAFAALAGALAIERAAVDCDVAVGLQTRGGRNIGIVAVVFAAAGGDGRDASAVLNVGAVGLEALGGCGSGLNIDDAAVNGDAVVRFDAMVRRGLHIDIRAGVEDEVIVGNNAVFGF